jgi:hypothetical protein
MIFPLVKEAKRVEDYAIKLHALLDTRKVPKEKLIRRIKIFFDYHDAAILDAKARLEQSISMNQRLLCEIHQLKNSLNAKSRKVAKNKPTRIPR